LPNAQLKAHNAVVQEVLDACPVGRAERWPEVVTATYKAASASGGLEGRSERGAEIVEIRQLA